LERKSAELVACVRMSQRFGAVWQCVSREYRGARGDIERGEVTAPVDSRGS